eukprot:2952679-Prorocentrum_lima.AAC.1
MSSTLVRGTRRPRLSPAGPRSPYYEVCKNYGYLHMDHHVSLNQVKKVVSYRTRQRPFRHASVLNSEKRASGHTLAWSREITPSCDMPFSR